MKAIIVVAVIAGPTVADACEICDLGRALQGGAYLHEELTIETHVDDAPGPRVIDQIGLAGFRVHAFAGPSKTISYHLGIDMAAGMTTGRHGGFAYDVGFLPLGIGLRLGRSSFLTLGTGIVANGATGAIDDAVALPLDVDLELDASRVRLIGWARASWIAGSPQRHDGSPSLPFADELDAMLGVRIGHHYEDYGIPTGNGPYIGVAYKEMFGTKFLGLAFGYSMDMATRPDHPGVVD
jgi:hypothetical protein